MAFVPQQDFCIATYASGSAALTNLEVDGSGNYAPPKWTYKPYSKPIPLGDGSIRGGGWAVAEWVWEIITDTQRDWLRNFIPGQSAEVWIKTKTMDNDSTGSVFRGIAVWPIDSEDIDTTRRMKFSIKFQRLTTS